MIIHGRSDVGRVRTRNEDRYLVREFSAGHVLIAVMDGMGGQPSGALAAQLAHDVLAAFVPDQRPVPEQLHDLVLQANAAVALEELSQPELYGMGSTLTVALINNGVLHYAHVGDSRLFHYNGASLVQVTTDHNMAQFLYEEGKLTKEEARCSPMRNLLDQCLGGSFMGEDIASLRLSPGDRLLLCSDGIHDEITVEQITAVMSRQEGAESLCHSLVQLALEAGGTDNITAVVLEY